MDLTNLLRAFTGDREVSIVQLGTTTKPIFQGICNKFDCKQNEYEVVKFEKNHYDGSYSIVVITN